jgi:CubicO group peptidase (beta-lactamase class C family)
MAHWMRRLAAGLLALAAANAALTQTPTSTPLDRMRVEAFVDGAVAEAMREDQIAGAAVAIVDRSGVVLTKGYGLAGVDPRRPVDPDTLFRVGSISKTPVWIAVMQLVEQGRISLDDPVNDHLPPNLKIADDGFREPVRVRHLMTHSAGFEDTVLGGFFVADADHLTSIDTYLRTHRVRRVRPPGTVAVYSNYGAALAGALVAHVSGEAWPDYAERHIFRPLGMMTATYREPYSSAQAAARGLPAGVAPATAARISTGFDLKAGALEPQKFEYIGHMAPAGALSASGRDMAVYLGALLDPVRLEQAGVLRVATFAILRAPLLANTPEMGSWRHGFMDFSVIRGRPGFGHGGDLIYQHSSLEIYPQSGIGVFVTVNTPTGDRLRSTLPGVLLAEFAGPDAPRPPRATKAAAEGERAAGTYRPLRRPYFRTEAALMGLLFTSEVKALPDGDIIMPQGGDGRLARYYPIGRGVFQSVDSATRIAFHDQGGRMLMMDPFSAGPAEQIGFLDSPICFLAVAGLAGFTAIWGLSAAVRRLFKRKERGRTAGLILDSLCVIWLMAFGLTAAGASALGDQNTAVLTYPGTLLPVACWTLLAAAVATPVASLLVLWPARPRGWGAWRWTRQVCAMSAFLALAALLWRHGLLGYSGW